LALVFVEGAGFVDKVQEGAPAVVQVFQPVFDLGGAEGMDVEGDVLAFYRSHFVRGRGPG
jgi:hypothetical protein